MNSSPDQTPQKPGSSLAVGVIIALAAPVIAVMVLVALFLTRPTTPAATKPAVTAPATAVANQAVPSPTTAPTVLPTTAANTPGSASSVPTKPAATAAPTTAGSAVTAAPTRFKPVASVTPGASATSAAVTGATLTPAPAATATTAASPTTAASATPVPNSTGAPGTPTPAPTSSEIAFQGVRTYFDQNQNGLRVVGEFVNNTASAQQVVSISGTFYGDQGQVIATDVNVFDFIPAGTVPAGGRAPFELLVDNIQSAARYDLVVDHVVSLTPVRADFAISGVTQRIDDTGRYCLSGSLQNNGAPLTDSLTILAVLYDTQNRIVNFDDAVPPDPTIIQGSQKQAFDICVPPPIDGVTRYEVRALGQ